MSWLSKISDATARLESPESFWYWSFLAAISAVVKDNIWLERDGAFQLYPNIYVMLLARSGLKKGPPIRLAKDLVKVVKNTRIISGRSSIQGILKELGTGYTIEGQAPMTKSVGFVVASEFTSSLVEDRAAMTILTDLYDRHWNEGEWKSLLKMETFKLKDPTLSMLVATNNPHFKDFVPEKDVLGGFIGRMFVIAEDKRRCLNPLIRKTDLFKILNELKEGLREYMIGLGNLKGEFIIEEDAIRRYETWYSDFYHKIDAQDYVDDTGTVDRFGDSVLKVAMLISLASDPELKINNNSMEEAILVCEKLVGNIRKVTLGKGGKSSMSFQKTLIIEELLKREPHEISREILLKKYWMHFGHEELDTMMVSFKDAGLITTEIHGATTMFIMPDAVVEKLQKFMEGKG